MVVRGGHFVVKNFVMLWGHTLLGCGDVLCYCFSGLLCYFVVISCVIIVEIPCVVFGDVLRCVIIEVIYLLCFVVVMFFTSLL